MINDIGFWVRVILLTAPFIILELLSSKANLKKKHRNRQYYMPIVAIVFCIVVGVFLAPISNLIIRLVNMIPGWLTQLADWLNGLNQEWLLMISSVLAEWARKLAEALRDLNLSLYISILFNVIVMAAYLLAKTIVVRLMKPLCKEGKGPYDFFSNLVYYYDGRQELWLVKRNMVQARWMLQVLHIATLILAPLAMLVTVFMMDNKLIASMYYPVFSIIMVSELFFFFDGLLPIGEEGGLVGEGDRAFSAYNYTLMRGVLRRLFGDKLLGENTAVNNDMAVIRTNDEMIGTLEEDDDKAVEAYGKFIRTKVRAGLELDPNYMKSGLDLLQGKSVLFNNPFYYDLIPYISYPMNRTILRRKKVLIVLGRHAIEDEIIEWCKRGLSSVVNIPDVWSVGVLDKERSNLDVGVVTRSQVHDLKLHEANDEFFSEVEFVMLIEPSKLVATAQIGLNSLVRYCRRDNKRLVFCSVDKNSDGIVDALSHILMTSLEEVSATNRHGGTSSYMCWEADGEYLQHRLLPNLSRYLGVGTELSFAALKNQISKVSWFGGEAFPVRDMHWIAKQYHYDLLNYASLPTQQSLMDEVFKATSNMWDAAKEDYKYITVEDEGNNMYEVQREFSTRAKKMGFINVISSEYLLKDYMAANDGIFHADSKAIPNIVADYAGTERNITYRICLRLSAYPVTEAELVRELSLINVDTKEISSSLWKCICKCIENAGIAEVRDDKVYIHKDEKEHVFDSAVIEQVRKYSYKTGEMENFYTISNKRFVEVFLDDLCSAEYIAEDEKGETQYLGTELKGHIFQKYLPGQFFTFGGKYYEMLRLTGDGEVLVRRAADHINGRPQYRQVRNYTISSASETGVMGDIRDINGVKVTKLFADIAVDTPAYWDMQRRNDFAKGRLVSINGIPRREYRHKQILCIDFGAEVQEQVIKTITLLMNELFDTLYADNKSLIAAVCAGDVEAPLTYSLSGADEFTPLPGAIYIIEDSQLDVGLLVSVERNISRIFSIMCDYLEWHFKAYEESVNPPAEPEKEKFVLPEEYKSEGSNILKKLYSKIGHLLKRKKKMQAQEPEVDAETIVEETVEGTGKELVQDTERVVAESISMNATEQASSPEEPKKAEETPVEENVEKAEETPAEESVEKVEETTAEENEAGTETPPKKGLWGRLFGGLRKQPKPTEEESTVDETAEAPAVEESEEGQPTEIASADEPSKKEKRKADREARRKARKEAREKRRQERLRKKGKLPIGETPEASEPEGEEEKKLVEEVESAIAETEAQEDISLKRKPYHERYYTLFGKDSVPEMLDLSATHELLKEMHYDHGFLAQARLGKEEAMRRAQAFRPNRKGAHYCDFCGVELMGTEYEVLGDGRERCMNCSRTAVKTEAEFRKIYEDVIQNMRTMFNVTITAPVQVKMVNAKVLHKSLGKSFVPTNKADGRVLGVAIKDKKGGYSILIENGSPRMSATATLAHELTHIWQYLNWDAKKIRKRYGKKLELMVYEGMAKWTEIQYLRLLNEKAYATREEVMTRSRADEYGYGFRLYEDKYPLSDDYVLTETPFMNDLPL